MPVQNGHRVAVLIPCYNEQETIEQVVKDFQAVLPEAEVHVYDNNSTDATAERARSAGAIVRPEYLQGKGNVVRRMFSDIDADIYVLVDGDATYHPASALLMIDALLESGGDFINGARVASGDKAYRIGHDFGNKMLSGAVRFFFGKQFRDILSGYKVLSRRFVKSFPALSRGFEIETELAVHAMELRVRTGEIETPYGERPEGSVSKLQTIPDGIRIASTILLFIKEERPMLLFGTIALLLATISVLLGGSITIEFLETGLVPRFPTAILASGVGILAFLSIAVGFILESITYARREVRRLYYLSQPPIVPSGGPQTAQAETHPPSPSPQSNSQHGNQSNR